MTAEAHAADPHREIRDAVRKLCADYPGEYWRKLDRVGEYPTAFVKALTDSGFLSALIPEAYGGAGLGLSAAAATPFSRKCRPPAATAPPAMRRCT